MITTARKTNKILNPYAIPVETKESKRANYSSFGKELTSMCAPYTSDGCSIHERALVNTHTSDATRRTAAAHTKDGTLHEWSQLLLHERRI